MKKIIIIILILIGFFMAGCGDNTSGPEMHDTRTALVNEHITWGDSILWQCDYYISGLNRAYPGHTSENLLRLVEYYSSMDEPGQHTILIGTNDITQGIQDTMPDRLEAIFGLLHGTVEVISILPRSDDYRNAEILKLNERIHALTELWGHTYRDVHDDFSDSGSDGYLADQYTSDGLHLNEIGCQELFQ